MKFINNYNLIFNITILNNFKQFFITININKNYKYLRIYSGSYNKDKLINVSPG